LQAPLDIALVRVDNRLVHGQILEAWVPFLHASCIIVVNDDVASDFFRETVIRMAVPREVEVIVCGVSDFAGKLAFKQGSGQKTILLLSSIPDALKVYRLGFRYNKLNIGNVYNESCHICCTPSVMLSDEDIRDISSLHREGVRIELRRVPREKPIDFYDIVEKIQA
jgi:mannose/fructose/N-acetylgalactosamine-specific phosphotransferase system component IIB